MEFLRGHFKGLTPKELLHGHFVLDCIVLVIAVFYFLKCQNWCCALNGLDPVGKWEYNYLLCRIDVNLQDPSCGFINLLSKYIISIGNKKRTSHTAGCASLTIFLVLSHLKADYSNIILLLVWFVCVSLNTAFKD